MKKIGVVGLAHFHIFHIMQELMGIKGVKVTALADENKEFRETAGKEFNIPIFAEMDELLENSGADILVSAAVNNKKVDIIMKAIDRGIPVIVDKPMVTTLEDLENIERMLQKNPGAKLYMMLTERFNPSLYTAKRLIDKGEIGEIVNIISLKPHRFNPSARPEWFFDRRAYGGLLNDLAVHDIDIMRWFSDSDVKEITAATRSNKKFKQFPHFDDKSELLVRMADESTGYIRVDWLTPESFPFHGDYRLMVVGTKGQIEIYTANPKKPRVILCNDKKPPTEMPVISREMSMLEDFIRCFQDNNMKPVVSTQDALTATRTALEAQRLADNYDYERGRRQS